MKCVSLFAGCLFWLLFLTSDSLAQESSDRIPIWLGFDCDNDLVGQQIEYRLKEELRRSAGMVLVTEHKSSKIIFLATCVDPGELRGHQSIYGFVVLITNPDGNDYFQDTGVMRVGSDRVERHATSLVAMLDKVAIWAAENDYF